MTIRSFMNDVRAGATGIAAAAVTVMSLGGVALVSDHLWLVDQRDVLKTATDAAVVAATLAMSRQLARNPDMGDDELEAALELVSRRYVELNLGHLPEQRLEKAKDTLEVKVRADRNRGTVEVDAEADLGGTLFARYLPLLGNYTGPGKLTVGAGAECTTNVVEVVLALDVTHSMHQPFGDGRRLDVAVDAARDLIEVLLAGCEDIKVAVGIVPWDRTVRVARADAWKRAGWVDAGRFPPGHTWGGCLEDREHDRNHPHDSDGLSLALPSEEAFPAYLHPDTTLDADSPYTSTVYAELERIAQGGDRVGLRIFEEEFRAAIAEVTDNAWGKESLEYPGRIGGPNLTCTPLPMHALASDLDAVRSTLDSVTATPSEDLLWGITMAHLGVTWGRRMLAPSWGRVWGEAEHPIDPDERPPGEVTKALVLLTDGANEAGDRAKTLPGRAYFGLVGNSAVESYQTWAECARARQCLRIFPPYASGYSAVGRFGEGINPESERMRWASERTSRNDAIDALNSLMLESCSLAREEGLSMYTVSLTLDDDWNEQLIQCSGTAHTTDREDRKAFHFRGDDPNAIKVAFREIGQRLLNVRRTR